jgi:hypothetical protein
MIHPARMPIVTTAMTLIMLSPSMATGQYLPRGASGRSGGPGLHHKRRSAPVAPGVWGTLANPLFHFLLQSCQFLSRKVLHATDPIAGAFLWRPKVLDDRVHAASCV